MTQIVFTIQTLELCQRALTEDILDADALAVQSYLVSRGLTLKSHMLPVEVFEAYDRLVTKYGLNFVVNKDGRQV